MDGQAIGPAGDRAPRGTRGRALATCILALVLAGATLIPADATPVLAPFPSAVNVIPQAVPKVGNCIPFANNTDFGFSGFIYRNVPSFTMRPGTRFAFDLGSTNDVDVRRDIYFAQADHNPAPGNGNVRALAWTKVVSDSQVPANPRGNSVIGDYELVYQSEQTFAFTGGGLIIGIGASPPGAYADRGCEQVLTYTNSFDPSGMFYGRFWNKPDRDMSLLDRVTFATTFLTGLVVFGDSTPPIVSAVIDPPPGPDGWVEMSADSTTVTYSGVDEASGIESCSDPVVLTAPGIYELSGSCTDGAGNVGSTTVTVRIARAVEIDVMPHNDVNPYAANRAGPSTFLVRTNASFDAVTIDPSTATFGVTGSEPSIIGCKPVKADLSCRFDVRTAGTSDRLFFKGFADGVRVFGSDTVRVVGQSS